MGCDGGHRLPPSPHRDGVARAGGAGGLDVVRPARHLVAARAAPRPLPPSTTARLRRTLLMLASSRGLSIRDRLRTVAHFGLGVSVAGQLRENGHYDRVHAHFIDRAATVALVAARLLDVPYSVTAHAADIYVSPLLLRTKLAAGDFVTTCTGYNRSHLAEVAPEASGRIVLAYHGLDLERYDPTSRFPSTVPTMLAVGQLREKKGFIHLLHACSRPRRPRDGLPLRDHRRGPAARRPRARGAGPRARAPRGLPRRPEPRRGHRCVPSSAAVRAPLRRRR